MLYATCSLFAEENGAQVAAFVARHADAERLPTNGHPNDNHECEWQLLPDADQDGFFYALLAKALEPDAARWLLLSALAAGRRHRAGARPVDRRRRRLRAGGRIRHRPRHAVWKKRWRAACRSISTSSSRSSRKRWYWVDEYIAGHVINYRLSYNALTRQYRLSVGGLHRSFASLDEALRVLGRVADLPIVDKAAIKPGETYYAALRLALDQSQLPKPFQVDAIASREWQVDARVLRWQFVARGGSKVSIALPVIAALGAILLFLLATASANTALFASHYPLLLGVNAVAALALLLLVVFQLRGLRREYRQRIFGSRLKSRLVLMLALMAVVPGALVYGVSMQFAVKSIDSWFDVRVDNALEGGLDLGRKRARRPADRPAGQGARDGARPLRRALGRTDAAQPAARAGRRARGHPAERRRQVLANSSGEIGSLLPSLPTPAQLRQARQSRGIGAVDGDAASGLMLRALVPVSGYERGQRAAHPATGAAGAGRRSPRAPSRSRPPIANIRRCNWAGGLKRIYTLTLTFTLLLALFAAVVAGLLPRRAAGAAAADPRRRHPGGGGGDFTPRAALTTRDELGVLTQSFNRHDAPARRGARRGRTPRRH